MEVKIRIIAIITKKLIKVINNTWELYCHKNLFTKYIKENNIKDQFFKKSARFSKSAVFV